jgi:hypothetical protein
MGKMGIRLMVHPASVTNAIRRLEQRGGVGPPARPTPAPPPATLRPPRPRPHPIRPGGQPYPSFRGLLDHLASLTRNQVRFTGAQATGPMLTEPTSTEREAFHLLGAPIPVTLK